MPAFSWNEAETEQLTTLFHEGLSFSQIAKNIATKTKNSCISKSKRIGLPHRGQMIAACEQTPREPVKRAPRPRIKATAETPKPVAPVKSGDSKDWRCTILQLKDCSCRFPLWETPEDDRLYCGRPTARLSEGRPYCAVHATLSYHTRP
jgi:GcrA cell cycle regulator